MITAQEKLDLMVRELKLRKRVYARMVSNGKISQNFVDYEILIMNSIVEDYQAMAQEERLL